VAWFLPRSEQFLRVLKPSGTFILNIKEKAENGERHTFVLELILESRRQGWLWTFIKNDKGEVTAVIHRMAGLRDSDGKKLKNK
jgi:hypothetical protein